MKVLLLSPRGATVGISLGMGYLASSLKRRGHSVKGLDLNNFRVDNPEILTREVIENYKPDIVGISVASLTYNTGLDAAKSIKEYYQGPIVFGGIHTFISKGQILQDNPYIDYALVGEAEESLPQLVESINDKGLLSKIRGLIFRNGVDVVTNEPAEFIMELDELPFPDYKCSGIERIVKYPLLTSRGCPYNCSFCLAPTVTGKTWRYRSVENIIQEIKWASKVYKMDSIQIMDDNFTLKKNRVMEFCDRYLQEGLKIPWECSNGIRADKVDYELAKIMRRAGLFRVNLGVESLHPDVFGQINKGESIEDIRRAVEVLKKVGVSVTGFFIIGLPGDTYERTMYSYNEAKKMGFDKTLFQILIPFPMTRVYNWVKDNANVFPEYYYSASTWIGNVTFETTDFLAQERREAYLSLFIKNFRYPYNIEKSKMNQLLYLLKLVLKYDFKNIHKHLYKFFVTGINIILKGSGPTLTGIHFRDVAKVEQHEPLHGSTTL